MDDYTTVTPGQTLNSYPADKFLAKSVRIDNPSGCWYRLEGNRQIIPPFTYGTTIVLQNYTRAITLTFLPTYGGQQSKIVGNPLSVYITSDTLPTANPAPITSALPYVNTFNVNGAGIGAAATTLCSIWPSVPMRIRLTYLAMECNGVGNGGDYQFNISTITADGAGTVVGSVSQDGDPLVLPQTTFRINMPTTGAAPTIGTLIRSYKWRVPTVALGRFSRSYNLNGPDVTPQVYGISGSLRGIAFTHTITGNEPATVNFRLGWTEEPLST